jgi:hypothetical protein
LEHIECRDGSGASFAPKAVVANTDHDGGAIKLFDKFSGDNADDSGVPMFCRDHEHWVCPEILLDDLHYGLGCDAALGVLTLQVCFVQSSNDPFGFVFIARKKQVESDSGVIETTDRINARWIPEEF